jgi:SAM-dependent methyltransferase
MPPAPPTLSPRQRKSTGAYYTPKPLIDLLLDHALPPLLATDNGQRTTDLKILDPACGPGDFLAAAAQRLAQRQVTPYLHGIDINPTALAQCRATLSAFCVHPSALECTDALLAPPSFLQPQSFDLVLGNPPFVNAIEKDLSDHTKRQLRQRHPTIKGAADLACYFLDQATRLVRPGGLIAFVLPRSLLNSPAAAHLRAKLPPYLKPNLIYAPDRHDFFEGAAVFITLLILGLDDTCKVSTDPTHPESARFTTGPITTPNWWQALQEILHPRLKVESWMLDVGRSAFISDQQPPSTQALLGDLFDLHASMTAADAYDLLPHLQDCPAAPGQRLVTTGLINPNTCLWGHSRCRYLRRDFSHPVVPASADLPKSLAARVAKSKRPKIILAGLAKKIECFLDTTGQYTGAVGTFSIYHPADDLPALRSLTDHLLHPTTTQTIIQNLGANALRGAHITLKKNFLKSLRLPESFNS